MLPVIDIGSLFSGNDQERLKTSLEIENALKTTGSVYPGSKFPSEFWLTPWPRFFYVVNHGLSEAQLNGFLDHGRKFFRGLDVSEKKRIARTEKVGSNGYVAIGVENLQDDQTLIDYKEAMDLCASEPHPLYKFNQWPAEDKLPGWKEETEKIEESFMCIGLKLVEAFALALGEKPDFFQKWYIGKPHSSVIRFLQYPPTPAVTGHTGCGAHSDYGLLTILLQDSVGGLQVLKEGEWLDVVPLPKALVINVGDCIELMTNGAYKATKHRVRNASAKDRSATVFFFEPAVDMPIEIVKKFIDEKTVNPSDRKLPKDFGEHLVERLTNTYA